MEKMQDISKHLQPIKKYTTRLPRSHENVDRSVDLVFKVPHREIQKHKYHYTYFSEDYGVCSYEIEDALSNGRSPVVIIRDYGVIVSLLKDYPDAIVIYIHSAYTGQELVRILKEHGREDIDADDRKIRELENFADYIKNLHMDLFHYHVYNYYDGSFVFQMKHYLSKHMEV
jgi:guanylate kinase